MSEEVEITEEEFDQEAQERGAWAARGWDIDEIPEIDSETMAEVEALVRTQLVGSGADGASPQRMATVETMPSYQLYLLIITQTVLFASLAWAFIKVHLCLREFPEKRWRLIATNVWLFVSIVLSVSSATVIAIGCPPLPVMRIIVWLDRTMLIVGFLSVGITSTQLRKLYQDRKNAD